MNALVENLALKMRLAVLWLFVAVAMSANTILYFVVPGVIDEIRMGKVVGMQATPELFTGNGSYVFLGSIGYVCSLPEFER